MCAQLHWTLCDPMDCSLPSSSVLGIFQLRIPEWVAISYSRESPQPRDQIKFPMFPALQVDSLSLLFNMLSRLVITLLPRSKCLLISWLQSPPAVILEPRKIKSDTVSTVSPSKSLQSWPTLCDPLDCSPPGSSIYGILQARILEWVAIPFCRGSSQPRD